MKCFYHSESDAVALCRSCSRGLCHECGVEVTPGVACKGKCEEEAKALNEMIERGKNTSQGRSSVYLLPMLLGLFFVINGLMPAFKGAGEPEFFTLILGGIFCLWSLLNLKRNR